MQAGPGLVTAQLVRFQIGQVPNPVVGQLGDERVAEGGAFLNVASQLCEKLGGHADDGDVADDDVLQPCPRLFSTHGKNSYALECLKIDAKKGIISYIFSAIRNYP